MNNNFHFAEQQLADVTDRLLKQGTTSILGIPGAGITLFLRQLSTQPLGHVVYLNVPTLPSLTTHEFYATLLSRFGQNMEEADTEALVAACQQRLEQLLTDNDRVVICVAGFDQLEPAFSNEFFRYLRVLRSIDPARVVFVFGVCRRLDSLLPADLIDADIGLFSSVYYLRPYSSSDMRHLLATYGPVTNNEASEIDRMIMLSGGHFQFLQLLLGSERRNNPVQDPFIQLAFNNIFSHLSTPQKNIVRKVTVQGRVGKMDDYLINSGLVQKTEAGYRLFSELFTDCVRAFSAPRLPVKERRLLAVLKKHQPNIVSKREIYDAVWRGQEIGSEWALNALIYRLRKHPAFMIQNYVIENHKKLGYRLISDR